MDMNKTVNVLNRGTGEAGYTLPDSGIRRNWIAGEIKKNITVSELEQVTYIPGGQRLLEKYLVINDEEVCEYLGIHIEPEYFYDEKSILTLLKTGTLDQLLDCLDFAPGGVLDLIKKISIDIKLNDVSKREAIKSKLGFDITAALANIDFANSKNEEGAAEDGSKRRAKPITDTQVKEDGNTARRVPTAETSKYNRVQK